MTILEVLTQTSLIIEHRHRFKSGEAERACPLLLSESFLNNFQVKLFKLVNSPVLGRYRLQVLTGPSGYPVTETWPRDLSWAGSKTIFSLIRLRGVGSCCAAAGFRGRRREELDSGLHLFAPRCVRFFPTRFGTEILNPRGERVGHVWVRRRVVFLWIDCRCFYARCLRKRH